jgi:two-component system, LytTR family, sensor kinase
MPKGSRRLHYGVFGLLFYLFWFLFKVGGLPDIPLALLSTTVDVLISMASLVITVEILLPRLIYKKKITIFCSVFLALVLSSGTLIILSQLRLLGRSLSGYQKDIEHYREHYFYWFWADLVFGSYFMVFFISAIGAAIQLAIGRMRTQHQLDQLLREKALSELELLKLQLNPHFLFNALNTVYYKIDRSNRQARDLLQRFSNMLRYQLYECNNALVEVEKELQFIRSYIDLQKERLNDNYTITCIGLDEIKGFLISPFLLMPLIENCFKHVSAYPDRENTIFIDCCMEGEAFRLRTINSVVESHEADSGKEGIGLENVKRRLGLVYPGGHELITERKGVFYEATLLIRIGYYSDRKN